MDIGVSHCVGGGLTAGEMGYGSKCLPLCGWELDYWRNGESIHMSPTVWVGA